MTNICSKPCVDISILSGAYINKCQNGMVFIQNLCKNGMVLNAQKTENIEWKQMNV